jgi:hypothetical protein
MICTAIPPSSKTTFNPQDDLGDNRRDGNRILLDKAYSLCEAAVAFIGEIDHSRQTPFPQFDS